MSFQMWQEMNNQTMKIEILEIQYNNCVTVTFTVRYVQIILFVRVPCTAWQNIPRESALLLPQYAGVGVDWISRSMSPDQLHFFCVGIVLCYQRRIWKKHQSRSDKQVLNGLFNVRSVSLIPCYSTWNNLAWNSMWMHECIMDHGGGWHTVRRMFMHYLCACIDTYGVHVSTAGLP